MGRRPHEMNREQYAAWSRVISFSLRLVGILGIIFVPMFWALTGRIELAFLPFFGTLAGVGQGLDVLKEISQAKREPEF
jgi:hypothetical protein